MSVWSIRSLTVICTVRTPKRGPNYPAPETAPAPCDSPPESPRVGYACAVVNPGAEFFFNSTKKKTSSIIDVPFSIATPTTGAPAAITVQAATADLAGATTAIVSNSGAGSSSASINAVKTSSSTEQIGVDDLDLLRLDDQSGASHALVSHEKAVPKLPNITLASSFKDVSGMELLRNEAAEPAAGSYKNEHDNVIEYINHRRCNRRDSTDNLPRPEQHLKDVSPTTAFVMGVNAGAAGAVAVATSAANVVANKVANDAREARREQSEARREQSEDIKESILSGMGRMGEAVNVKLDEVNDNLEEVRGKVDKKLDGVNKKLEEMHGEVTDMHGEVTEMRGEVREQLENIDDALGMNHRMLEQLDKNARDRRDQLVAELDDLRAEQRERRKIKEEKERERLKLENELFKLAKDEKELERKLRNELSEDVKKTLKELKNQIGEKKNEKNVVENFLENIGKSINEAKKNLGIDERKICSN